MFIFVFSLPLPLFTKFSLTRQRQRRVGDHHRAIATLHHHHHNRRDVPLGIKVVAFLISVLHRRHFQSLKPPGAGGRTIALLPEMDSNNSFADAVSFFLSSIVIDFVRYILYLDVAAGEEAGGGGDVN